MIATRESGITDIWLTVFAGLSFLVSIIALVVALYSSRATNSLAKKHKAFELKAQWDQVSDIKVANPIPTHVTTAHNVMSLTAQCWNEDMVDKILIHESYWGPYKSLYDKMNGSSTPVEGTGKMLKQFISDEMRRAYSEMDNWRKAKEQ